MSIDDEHVRNVGQYILGETLGKGGYSWVKKGTDKQTGKQVALKFMTRTTGTWEKEQAEQVKREIKSMVRIKSKYVMKLFAYNLNAKYPEKDGNLLNTVLLVLEYCPGGELFDILYYCQKALPEMTARTYFRQMVQGIEDCHAHGVIHRDMKPQNMLMDANYQLKICDFGLSYLLADSKEQDETMKTYYVGTRGYQAPELLSRQKFTKACDIFSCGVVLFILLTGYPPFDQATKADKWYRPMYKKDFDGFWKMHKNCGVSDSCKSLLEGMLAYKPSQRYTMDDVKHHPWYNEKVHSPDELKQVLTGLHEKATAKRRADKKKITDMQDSVKKRNLPGVTEVTPIEQSFLPPSDVLQKWREAWGEPAPHDWNPLTKFCCPVEGNDPLEIFFNIKAIFEGGVWEGKVSLDELDADAPYSFNMILSGASLSGGDVHKFRVLFNAIRNGDEYFFIFRLREGCPLKWRRLYMEIERFVYGHVAAFCGVDDHMDCDGQGNDDHLTNGNSDNLNNGNKDNFTNGLSKETVNGNKMELDGLSKSPCKDIPDGISA